MAASSSQVLRKTIGTLRDASKVGLAKVQSDYKELDIAVVKASNHVECPPKEKHVRRILASSTAARPRADVAYLIAALAKRLQKTHNWIVAVKTLIVVHRVLREGDSSFREELLNYSRNRGQFLNMSNFKDDSSPEAWDYSAWTRTYALFLEERLECFRVLKFDVESERSMGHSRTRDLDCPDLLKHLPALQQLLYRLMCCQPEGAAVSNQLIGAALSLVLKESFKLYRAINDGIINLVDKFFEMARHDAVQALEIYKLAGKQAEKLSEFYECCKQLELGRSFQFPTLEQPPVSFLTTMEEYVKDAPRTAAPSSSREDGGRDRYDERDRDGDLDRRDSGRDTARDRERKDERPRSRPPPEFREYRDPLPPHKQGSMPSGNNAPRSGPRVPPAPLYREDSSDLLGLQSASATQEAAQIEDANAFALAIVPQGASSGGTTPLHDNASPARSSQPTTSASAGWDLALVPADGSGPGSNKGVSFDKLVLDSLYDDAMSKRGQNAVQAGPRPGTNPFEAAPAVQAGQDPFAASNKFAPPPSVQMAAMAQQQAMMQRQQQAMLGMPLAPGQNLGANPFGNPAAGFGGVGGASPYRDNAGAYSNNPFL
ncbi:hypothetical protein CBR_g29464 [Chara braunii]|uniref:ENTH domain-containing protein n=1 Tax=Chara braunii TaxID=69332 RepID=A0A388LAG7_CHABU|nr:hypothetical protein CBR_g29464 [Chara braunii]|eukprot:GBG79315.1 hypothetical protein CBR_g29464 [Chara braunii]